MRNKNSKFYDLTTSEEFIKAAAKTCEESGLITPEEWNQNKGLILGIFAKEMFKKTGLSESDLDIKPTPENIELKKKLQEIEKNLKKVL